jgi:hypothetical protein
MSSVEHKHNTDFVACFETYRKAVSDLMQAVLEHRPEEAKVIRESLSATHEKVAAINNVIKAAKRKERTDNLAKWMPREADEVLVDICPCNAESWMQNGRVLMAWHDEEPAELAIWAAIEITRAMTDEENAGRDWQSDDTWNGCLFICRYNDYLGEWRAKYPVNERAQQEWGEDEDE